MRGAFLTQKRVFLAGASMIAMLVAGQARALTFDFTGAETTWVAPVSGVYDITAYGAQGAPFDIQSADWARRRAAMFS